ncbi:type I polyketide synthase [Photobacterium gaetbulicola]|uniref:type I polyketide synthase n=1 Tax=Photobacterium gaetbulicola TaxID=1295392 RepID=UPI00068B166F|nr:type I polyketide synthase [Photobacterium gaetbulicola]
MIEQWIQFSELVDSYCENASFTTSTKIENELKELLSHHEDIVDVLASVNDGIVTMTIFSSSAEHCHESDIYAALTEKAPGLDGKIAIQVVAPLSDAICKGERLHVPDDTPPSLAEAFRETATNFPAKELTFHEANGQINTLTYQQLFIRASQLASYLATADDKKAAPAVLVAGEMSVYLTAFWGCVLAGCPSLTVLLATDYLEDDINTSKLAQAIALLRPGFVLCCDEGARRLGKAPELLGGTALLNVSDERHGALADPVGERITPLGPLFYQLTSGSTGQAKAIPIGEEAVMAQIHAVNQHCGYHRDQVSLNWLPFDHVIALLAVHIHDVYLGRRQIHIATPLVLADPLYWLRTMAQYRATHCFAPNFAFRLVLEQLERDAAHGIEDLSCVEQIVSGGEAVAAQTVNQFIQAFASAELEPTAIQPSYGMAEAAAGATFEQRWGVPGTVIDLQEVEGNDGTTASVTSLGRVLPGLAMRVVGPGQAVLKEREIGEIQLFGQKMCHAGKGWFGTGDLGFIDHQRLFVTGRVKDVIIVNGANFYSHQLEAVVADVDGIRAGSVAVVSNGETQSETVAVFYVPQDEREVGVNDSHYLPQIAAIKRTLGKATGLSTSVVLPLTEAQFPRTSIGKIKRVALQDSLRAGLFGARIDMIGELMAARLAPRPTAGQSSQAITPLREIWKDVLQVSELDENANFFELGGNSVLSVQLIAKVNQQLGLDLATVTLFDAPSLKQMAAVIAGENSLEAEPKAGPGGTTSGGRDIAIIGLAGVFPGASDIDEFWQKLVAGEDLVRDFSEQELLAAGVDPLLLSHEDYIARGGMIEGSNEFDAAFFDYPLKDAELMDPQSRLLHQQCWHALENAGYRPSSGRDVIGLYVGASSSCNMDWMSRASRRVTSGQFSETMTLHTLADRDFIATRIAYAIGLTGPALTVQTACSTGLVATHTAIQALREGSCTLALAGAASVKPLKQGYQRQSGMMLSHSGICRPFDAEADGTVFTEGVGVVVLKLLENATRDGDNIIAVIKGAAVNNDGHRKVGYLAPGIQGQESVIRSALADAQVGPDSVSYVEAHGTATQLGDPIEVRALANVFGARQVAPCRLGSVKSNIGHAEAAAGMAGLIKSALAVYHKQVPASLHFRQANPQIDFANAGFEVNRKLWDWRGAPRPYRAGVSSFGIGGTNAHMIIEEPPVQAENEQREAAWSVLPISAKTATALVACKRQLADFLAREPHLPLDSLAYTLAVGREHFAYRQAILCRTREQGQKMLEQLGAISPPQKKSLFLMFPGQGAQYSGMLSELMASHSPYRDVAEQCLAMLPESVRADLSAVIAGKQVDPDRINDTALVQPALFIIQYSLAKVVTGWGLTPDGMIGHSLGEYVAATLAGVMALEDALNLVVARGGLMSQAAAGSMLGVSLSEEAVKPYLSATIDLAAVNGPSQCVLSGNSAAIEALALQLQTQGISCQQLPVSHAYHSYLMDSLLDDFVAHVATVPMERPSLPYISTLTGDWITDEVLDPHYWARHLRETVCFNQGIELAMAEPSRVFVDMGPGKTLGSLLRQHPALQPSHSVVSLTRHRQESVSDAEPLFAAAASLYESGIDLDWSRLNLSPSARRVALPRYPFEPQNFEWVLTGQENYRRDAQVTEGVIEAAAAGKRSRPVMDVLYRAPETFNDAVVADFWSDELGIINPGLDDEFFELGGDSLVMLRLVNRINEHFGIGVTVTALMEARTIAEQVMLVELVNAHQDNESEDFEMDLGELL